VIGQREVRHRVIWHFSDRTIERNRRAQVHLPSEWLLAGLQEGAKFSSRETFPRSVTLSVLDRISTSPLIKPSMPRERLGNPGPVVTPKTSVKWLSREVSPEHGGGASC
jgi:hypothetical protein